MTQNKISNFLSKFVSNFGTKIATNNWKTYYHSNFVNIKNKISTLKISQSNVFEHISKCILCKPCITKTYRWTSYLDYLRGICALKSLQTLKTFHCSSYLGISWTFKSSILSSISLKRSKLEKSLNWPF